MNVCVLGNDHLASVAREAFQNVSASSCDWLVLAHDVPVLPDGDLDMAPIELDLWTCAPQLLPFTPIIVMSQVRVGTCEALEASVRRVNPTWKSGVVYVPENLKLSDGVERFLSPDFLVFGSDHAQALRSAFKLFDSWTCPKLTMSLRSAEMVKHAINGWLAMNITYANAIAALSHSVGADEVAVSNAMRLDKRLANAPLRPGLPYPKQGTLGRDVYTLKKLCAEFGMEPCVK